MCGNFASHMCMAYAVIFGNECHGAGLKPGWAHKDWSRLKTKSSCVMEVELEVFCATTVLGGLSRSSTSSQVSLSRCLLPLWRCTTRNSGRVEECEQRVLRIRVLLPLGGMRKHLAVCWDQRGGWHCCQPSLILSGCQVLFPPFFQHNRRMGQFFSFLFPIYLVFWDLWDFPASILPLSWCGIWPHSHGTDGLVVFWETSLWWISFLM